MFKYIEIESELTDNEKTLWDLIEKASQAGIDYATDRYEDLIIKAKSPYLSLLFINKFKPKKLRYHEDIITRSSNMVCYAELLIWRLNNGYKIDSYGTLLLFRDILNYKNSYCNYIVARDAKLPSEERKELEEEIIKAKDYRYSYLCARDVPNSIVSEHSKMIVDSKDVYYNYIFLKDIKGADRLSHALVILLSKSDDTLMINPVDEYKKQVLSELLSLGELKLLMFEVENDVMTKYNQALKAVLMLILGDAIKKREAIEIKKAIAAKIFGSEGNDPDVKVQK